MTTTQEELAAAWLDLDAVTARSGPTRYDAFVQRFCPHEDGRAGERVVARLRSVLAG